MNIYKNITIFIVLFHSYVYVSSAQERNFIDTNSISGHDFLELEEGFKFCGRDLLDFIKTTKANNPGIDMRSIQLQAQDKIVSVLTQDEINKNIFQFNFINLVSNHDDLNSNITEEEYEFRHDIIKRKKPVDDFFKFVKNSNFLQPVAYAYLKRHTDNIEFKEPLNMIELAIFNDHNKALQYLESIGYYINDHATPLNLYQPTAWNKAQDALQCAYVIHLAVKHNAVNVLNFLLREDPANNKVRVNKKDNSGRTPLSLLVSKKNRSNSNQTRYAYDISQSNIGRILIQAQADIYETNTSGDNLLHLAARAENGTIIRLLLLHDITLYDKENNNGQIAWDIASSNMRNILNKIKNNPIIDPVKTEMTTPNITIATVKDSTNQRRSIRGPSRQDNCIIL